MKQYPTLTLWELLWLTNAQAAGPANKLALHQLALQIVMMSPPVQVDERMSLCAVTAGKVVKQTKLNAPRTRLSHLALRNHPYSLLRLLLCLH